MKKIPLLLGLIATTLCHGQNWKVTEGGSPFDGKHTYAKVTGSPTVFKDRDTGKEYQPTLEVLAFADNEVELKVNGIGIFKDRGKQLLWALDSEPNNIYKVALYTNDNSNKIPATAFDDGYRNTTLTIKGFYYPKSEVAYFYPIEMLDKMATASTLYLRVRSSEGDSDFSFTLKGAAAAINTMVSKTDRDRKIAEIEVIRNPILAKENAKNGSKKEMYDQLVTEINQLPFNTYQINDLKRRLDLALEPDKNTGEMKQYTSILLEPDPSEGYFESTGNTMIYIVTAEGEKKDIGFHSMDMNSDTFKELLEQLNNAKQSEVNAGSSSAGKGLKDRLKMLKGNSKKKDN
jgi:hypothetical protein